MSDATPISAIVVAAVRLRSWGVQAPPLSKSEPTALLRLLSTSERVLSLICFDMDLRFACASGSRAGKHQFEYSEVSSAKRLN